MNAVIAASNQPDPKILRRLAIADRILLAIAAAIAAVVLCAWLVPAFGAVLPIGWSMMKANTALAVLLCAAGFVLTRPRHGAVLVAAGRACAFAAMLLAGVALFEHWTGRSFGLGRLLAPDNGAPMPGRMSIQTATFLILLGLSMMVDRTRQDGAGHTLDLLIAALTTFCLVLFAGYVFGAPGLVGQGWTRASPQTLACLAALTLAQTARRAPYAYFSVIVGVGIGSQFARIALPVSLVLTYLLIAAGASVAVSGVMGVPYAAGLTAAIMVALLFILIVMLGRKINELERALRDISLADELTGLHNRRGFYLLGEQARRDARRARKALTVLFFDADGLKKINDTLGHDTGSEFLRDIALLLRTTFRGSDVVGRLGGDEFGVVVRESAAELVQAQMRLRAAVAAANDAGAKAYRLSFSAGSATTEPDSNEAFAALVDRADAAMYEDKRQRRAAREDGFAPPIAIGKVAPPSLPSAAAPFSERSVQTPMSPVHA